MPSRQTLSHAQRQIRKAIRSTSRHRRSLLLNAILDQDHAPILADHLGISPRQLDALLSDGITALVEAFDSHHGRRQRKDFRDSGKIMCLSRRSLEEGRD